MRVIRGRVYYTREYSYVLYMMTVQFYNYLAAVEVQPQSELLLLTNLHVRAIALIGAAPLPGQTIDCPGQIRQIRDCPGDSGTVGAYVYHTVR